MEEEKSTRRRRSRVPLGMHEGPSGLQGGLLSAGTRAGGPWPELLPLFETKGMILALTLSKARRKKERPGGC